MIFLDGFIYCVYFFDGVYVLLKVFVDSLCCFLKALVRLCLLRFVFWGAFLLALWFLRYSFVLPMAV